MTTPTKRITPCPTPFTDHTYKSVHGVSLPLRVWPADNPKGWLLWLHGGGFTAGKHLVPNAWVVPAFRARGYAVVSAAYRFTPEVGLREILEDTRDAFAWCRANLADADVDAYVVGGDSAGGALAALAGSMFSPPPRAVIDLYGVVDLADPYFHPRRETAEEKATRAGFFHFFGASEDEIRRAIACRDASKAVTVAPWTWEMPPEMSDEDRALFWGTRLTPTTDADRLRMDVMSAMNRDRIMLATLLRKEDDEEGYPAKLKKYSATELVSADYPPTFFLHGYADKAVPIEQSLRMAAKLKALGVDVGERYHPTGEHCFENKIEGPEDDGWDEYIVPVMDFVDKHITAA